MAVSDQAVVTGKQLDILSINTIRTLSIDAVQKANSGHPGAPMAFAPVAYVLWQQFLRYDPANPVWPSRDRFILSNGHASMLLYSMLYLCGVKSVDSEYKILDRPSITLDGPADWSFSEDVAMRFTGYGWNVVHVRDANDLGALAKAFSEFLATKDRPTIIIVNSHIGYGAPHKQDTNAAHGEPLGEDEVRLAKKSYGWPEDAHFLVPDGVLENFRDGIGKRGHELRAKWYDLFGKYGKQFPELADQINRMQRRELPDGWDKNLPTFPADPKGVATRESSGKVLNVIAQNVPWLIGGAADLATSNKTDLKFEGAGVFSPKNYGGRNLHFGVREHAMGASLNGMAMIKVRPFGGTFFNFTDYMRPAMRLAAITEIPTIYVLTHDSIGLGEDGPTHQPIEQLASLRAMPHMIVMRPGDANEVVEAWKVTM